jgi:hypothetical protein
MIHTKEWQRAFWDVKLSWQPRIFYSTRLFFCLPVDISNIPPPLLRSRIPSNDTPMLLLPSDSTYLVGSNLPDGTFSTDGTERDIRTLEHKKEKKVIWIATRIHPWVNSPT